MREKKHPRSYKSRTCLFKEEAFSLKGMTLSLLHASAHYNTLGQSIQLSVFDTVMTACQ